MKANELRIGNLIEMYVKESPSISDTHIVEPATMMMMEGTIQNRGMSFRPILLTEDWLLNLGFDRLVNEMQIDGIEMRLQVSGEGRDGTWFSSCGTLSGGMVVMTLCRGNYVCNNVEFVHEIQNLYFALTGEELVRR